MFALNHSLRVFVHKILCKSYKFNHGSILLSQIRSDVFASVEGLLNADDAVALDSHTDSQSGRL